MTKSDDSDPSNTSRHTFGTAFGDLIRKLRGQEGITQRELALRAFGDDSKVRRIIDLETGAVHRPHATTIDPLVVYFDIQDDVLARCRTLGLFSSSERTAIGLPRELLENLALRFEITDPDAEDEELVHFLKSKAKELKELKTRLSKIDGARDAVRKQIRLAEDAIANGEFAEAEDILAGAEEEQQESNTLKSIDIQVEIRMARADNALMLGNSLEASKHYGKAARYFLGFSKSRTASVLAEGAGRIYEVERRARRPMFSNALPLAKDALTLTPDDEVSSLFLRGYQFSMLLLSQSRSTKDKQLLDDAEGVLSNALDKYGACADEYDLLNAKIVLGNIFLQRAEIGGRGAKSALGKALQTYHDCITSAETSGQVMQICHLHNNIATAYRHSAQLGQSTQKKSNLQKSRHHLREAVKFSGEHGHAEVWASAQYNLGGSFAEEAPLVDNQLAYFFRIQAIAAYQASMEAYPQTAVNWQLARSNLALGRVLFDHALQSAVDVREVYLFRSLQHSEIAASMYEGPAHSLDLALCHFQIGIAFFVHSEDALEETALGDLEKALVSFGRCMSALGDQSDNDLGLKCAQAIEGTKNAMSKLAEPQP